MSNILFSVLLVTYNSELSDIFKTLTSIINQEFEHFEIVLSDDGSEDNKFKQIEEFMKEHKFFNYKMVGHDKNQGTVKNLISGLENCSGKYVRDFGPGDMFYTKDSLKKLYEFMEKLPDALRPGGRAAILTFHSGEDKLVKKALKQGYKDGIYLDYAKDVIRPSAQECAQNGRARSTKMRWAIKA